jgi:hypothetical protein
MSQNAERFLACFNAIERHLQKNFNNGNHGPFRMLLNTAANKNAIYKRFLDDLYAIGDLRNAIVHSDRFDGRPIAEPELICLEKEQKEKQ